jgi:tetratricopeptide (TPR) repeat protein
MNISTKFAGALLLLALWIPATCTGTPADGEKKIPITTNSVEARETFLKGRQLVDNLRLTDANPLFKKAVELDPGFALGHLFVAQTSASAKEFFAGLDKALENAGKATEGEKLWIQGVRAGAYADPGTQQKCFAQLVALFPGDERAHMLLGVYHFGQQDYDKAVQLLKRSTEISSGFAPAYNQLGYAYRLLGRYEEAEATFKKYTELLPDDPNPYDSYAELLLKIGRFQDAIAQYDKALVVDGHFANSYAGISSALTYEGKHAEALVILDKAAGLARTDGEKRAALFSRTVVYADRGDFDLALKEMEKQFAVAKNTGDVAGMSGDMVFMGNILIEKGEGDAALTQFEKANAMVQASTLAKEVKENTALIYHYNAGRAALAKHDMQASRKHADRFRSGVEKKKNVNQTRLAHELDGRIALEEKKFDRASTELQKANLQNPYVLYLLATAYESGGNTEKAAETMRQAAHFNSLPALNYAFIRSKAEQQLKKL